MQGRLAQPLARPYGPLLGEAPLECDRLLEVERLEVAALGVGFKARERLRDRVDARLALPPRLLEVRKVPALDPFVVRVVA